MIALFKKKTGNTGYGAGTALVAQRVATSIIFYQRSFADHLQKILHNVPLKIQGYAFALLTCLSLFYCGSLIFGAEPHPLFIKTIKPIKETKVFSADSLQKLEHIYQFYLKR